MQRAKRGWRILKKKWQRAAYPGSMLLALLFLYGCGGVGPPADYYQEVVAMEEQGEQVRQDTGRSPDQVVVPVMDTKPMKVDRKPTPQVASDEPPQQIKETLPVIGQEEEAQERPPQREIIQESPLTQESVPEPIAVRSDVIKNALEAANLKISVRTVELVDGRLSGGKNSVRIYFIPESMNVIDDRFGAICAVLYYLDNKTNTVDIVAGLAEDEQSNLLAILQVSIGDITAWMTDEITRIEWNSRITKKIL